MNPFGMSNDEREKIRKKHEEATKRDNERKERLAAGLQQPNQPKSKDSK